MGEDEGKLELAQRAREAEVRRRGKGVFKGDWSKLEFRFLGWTLGGLGLNRYKTVTLCGLTHSRDMSYIEIVHTLI